MNTDTKVLIVEDERITSEDLARTLNYLGYSVCGKAATSEEALKEVEEKQPNLILMDVKLKGETDGVMTSKLIQERFDIPIIYMTAMTDEATLQRVKVTKPFGFVCKPIDEKDLKASIEMGLYRHELVKKLKEREEQYRDLVEKSGIAILIDDTEGNLKYSNEKLAELFGYSIEEMRKQSIRTIVHPDDVERVIGYHKKRILGEKAPSRYEFKGIKKDGSEIYLEVDVVVLKKEGSLIGTRTYIWDITERVKTEKALRENEELLRNVFESMNEGIFVLNTDYRLSYWNRGMEVISNTPKKDVLGKVPWEIFPFLEAGMKEAMEKAMNGDSVINKELQYRLPDGKEGWTSESYFPLRDYEGKVTGMVGVIDDITERKRTEEEKEKLQAQLVHSEKMAGIGTLAGGIAHEFNNLLQIMRGHIEFAQKTQKKEDIEEAYDLFIRHADRAATIIKDLLTFSIYKPSEKKMGDITEAVEAVLLLVEEQFKKQNIEVVRKYTDVSQVEMNKAEMQQVFLNMITNARDSMLSKGGTLVIGINQDEKNVKVSFNDSGRGIEKKNLSHVFDPFYTTKQTANSDSMSGTGLGLSVSYGVVKRHGGTIEVDSEPGKGTTFTVKLPVTRVEVKRRVIEKNGPVRAKEAQDMNILVADDEVVICNMLEKWLTSEGFRVKTVSTGKRAIDMINKEFSDVLFLDLIMPGMPAMEVIEKIKEISPETKVVIITGQLPHSKLLKDLKQKGASSFIQKPFKIDDILQTIKSLTQLTLT